MASRAQNRTTTDHDEIRRWAEERDARPACVRGTGGDDDVGVIGLDFPGYGGDESLEEISWDEWFGKFEESGLALIYQETPAGGQRSNFNKLISREAAGGEVRRQGKTAQAGSSGRAGTARTTATRRRRAVAVAVGARRAKRAGTARKRAGATKTAPARGRRATTAKSTRKKAARRSTTTGRRVTASARKSARKTSARTTARGVNARGSSRQARRTTTKRAGKVITMQSRKATRGRGRRAA